MSAFGRRQVEEVINMDGQLDEDDDEDGQRAKAQC